MSLIVKKENIIIVKKVVKANLKDDYYSKLCHLQKTSQLAKKINFHHFFHLLVDIKNCFYQYSQFWISKNLYLLMLGKINNEIVFNYLKYKKPINILACNYYSLKRKHIIYYFI